MLGLVRFGLMTGCHLLPNWSADPEFSPFIFWATTAGYNFVHLTTLGRQTDMELTAKKYLRTRMVTQHYGGRVYESWHLYSSLHFIFSCQLSLLLSWYRMIYAHVCVKQKMQLTGGGQMNLEPITKKSDIRIPNAPVTLVVDDRSLLPGLLPYLAIRELVVFVTLKVSKSRLPVFPVNWCERAIGNAPSATLMLHTMRNPLKFHVQKSTTLAGVKPVNFPGSSVEN